LPIFIFGRLDGHLKALLSTQGGYGPRNIFWHRSHATSEAFLLSHHLSFANL
jgi:hypothetical protein